MLAGFVGELVKSHDKQRAFKQGLACVVQRLFTRHCTKAKIDEVANAIEIFEKWGMKDEN